MENRKILFFDIDGTLLSHKTWEIPQSTIRSLKRAKEKGHLLFINTGRTLSVLDDYIRELDFDGYICGCGSYIEVDGEVVYSNEIDRNKYKEIIDKIQEYDLNVVLEGRKAVYYDGEISDDPVLKNFIENNYTVKGYNDEDLEFDKMYIRYGDNPYIKDFCEFVNDTFNFINHGKGQGEMIPNGHSKATAIDFILDRFGIDDKNSFAFGDSNNDLAMLERVPNSVLMGNGNLELSDKVTFVTKDIDEDGIEYAMKHFEII